MKTYDLIMVNMSNYAEWQHGVSNRNYHVLRELTNNPLIGKVLAVDYPPLTFKRAIRNYKETILPTLQDGTVIRRSAVDKLTRLSDRLHIYTNLEYVLRPERAVARIRQTALDLNFGDFLVWSYFPPIMPNLRGIGQKLTIFDAVDNWIEHSSYRQFRNLLMTSYEFIKKNADLIFTVAEDLLALFDKQSNAYWIPNGVDLRHYQDPQVILNRDIADLPKPIVGYIGVVQDRVDVDLIAFTAKKNPTKSFVIVGPVWRPADLKVLKSRPNIHLLGYKSYEEAPAYIQQFDVALIPHRKTSFITSTNPMKLYEYLAAGKPVVATADSGAEQFKNMVYIAKGREDFSRKIFLALEEDRAELRESRKKAMLEHSWGAAVRQMTDLIQRRLSY